MDLKVESESRTFTTKFILFKVLIYAPISPESNIPKNLQNRNLQKKKDYLHTDRRKIFVECVHLHVLAHEQFQHNSYHKHDV